MTGTRLIFDLAAGPMVRFGGGRLLETGDLLARRGLRRPLVVTDWNLAGLPAFFALHDSLTGAGLSVEAHIGLPGEPTPESINAAAAVRDHRPDCVIGFGGGSVLDTAKAVGVLLFHEAADIRPFAVHGDRRITGSLPVAAVPTTAGTGSEVTGMSLFTDDSESHKALLRHEALRPMLAVIDPDLALEQSWESTLSGGVDALCHAVECLTKPRFHPYADGLARQAAETAFAHLPRLRNDPEDREAREGMAAAALLAGQALDAGGLQFHAFAHVLGARFHLPHGITCGLVLTAGLRQAAAESRDKLARLGSALAPELRARDPREAAEQTMTVIEAWLEGLGLYRYRSMAPLTPDDLPELLRGTRAGLSRPMAPDRMTAIWKDVIDR